MVTVSCSRLNVGLALLFDIVSACLGKANKYTEFMRLVYCPHYITHGRDVGQSHAGKADSMDFPVIGGQ